MTLNKWCYNVSSIVDVLVATSRRRQSVIPGIYIQYNTTVQQYVALISPSISSTLLLLLYITAHIESSTTEDVKNAHNFSENEKPGRC